MVGDGELKNNIIEKIKESSLENEILCLGNCDNISEILSVCDFAVFPSAYEGFSLSMLEKMASSLPVICSDIPAFREIIKHGENGYLMQLFDFEAWTDKIKMLVENDILRFKLGEGARKRSKDFTDKIMTKKYEDLYHSLMV